MKRQITHLAINRPRLILWGMLLITLALGSQIPRIVVDTDPENMLPHDQADRVRHEEIKQNFNLYDMLVVGIINEQHPNGVFNPTSLDNVKKLTDYILTIEGVVQQDLMSLSTVDNITQEGLGTLRFQWMMNESPTTQAQADDIQKAVKNLPLLDDTLVSDNGRALAIYVPITSKDQSYGISTSIQTYIDTQLSSSNDEYHITGLPVAEDTFGVEMFIQMAISAPLAALVIFILMWVFFRSPVLISAPMLVAMAAVLSTMGLLIGMGFTVHIMSSMIPIFLMPIAVVDSIHILSEFAERHKPGDDPKNTVAEVVEQLFTPMLYTSVTSTIGFASLAFTPIPPVQIFGLFVAFGIALAFLFTITFIPAYIVNLSPARIEALATRHHKPSSPSLLARGLERFAQMAIRRAGLIMLATAAVVVMSAYGIQRIQINDNPVRWFKESHPIRVADKVLNHHFAGTYSAFLVLNQESIDPKALFLQRATTILDNDNDPVQSREQLRALINSMNGEANFLQSLAQRVDEFLFENSPENTETWEALMSLSEQLAIESKTFQAPDNLKIIEKLQAHLMSTGYVGKTNGLPEVVKTVYRELKGGEQSHYALPTSSQAIAQTLLSYQSSHRPDDLWHFVTPDYQSTVIWLQLKSGDNLAMSQVLKSVDDYFIDNPLPEGISADWGGLTYINVIWQEAMVSGMLKSLMGAFVMVLIIMIILFRSLIFGLLAMVPLTITIGSIYGLIGWVGKEYDMPVAVLSALTLGLSVDFAIHFLERTRAIYRETGNWSATIAAMFGEPALAISRNAIVIAVGFLPLLAAPLIPYQTVGFFLASIMAVSCIATLLLLPAILHLIRRWVFRSGSDKHSDSEATV